MNGGYLMVSKSDTNLYTKLNNALTTGKPVLFYENENTCYYIDTITKDGTDIVLTKGGKTITVESDGDITESGDIQNQLYYHGLDLYKSGENSTQVVVINNNDTPIDTIDKLKAWANSIDGRVLMPTNGCIVLEGVAYSIIAILKSATDTFNIIYQDTTGYASLSNVDLSTYFTNCADYCNKLI